MNRRWIWATGAVVAMWTAVVLVGLFAPNLVVESAAGDRVDMPVAVIVIGLLVFIATIVVAVVGFRDGSEVAQERRLGDLEARMATTEARLAGDDTLASPSTRATQSS
jgi:hypothetical protein